MAALDWRMICSTGKRKYGRLVEDAENYLAERMQHLEPDIRTEVVRGLQALHTIFEDPPEVKRSTAKRKSET